MLIRSDFKCDLEHVPTPFFTRYPILTTLIHSFHQLSGVIYIHSWAMPCYPFKCPISYVWWWPSVYVPFDDYVRDFGSHDQVLDSLSFSPICCILHKGSILTLSSPLTLCCVAETGSPRRSSKWPSTNTRQEWQVYVWAKYVRLLDTMHLIVDNCQLMVPCAAMPPGGLWDLASTYDSTTNLWKACEEPKRRRGRETLS